MNTTDVQTTLRNQALHLRSYQENLVEPMMAQTDEMKTLARKLDETLKFNRTSFKDAMDELRAEIANAADFIKNNGNKFVEGVATELKDTFLNQIRLYLDHVISKTQNDVGRCGPMSNVYNSVLVATCNRVVDPFVSFQFVIVVNVMIIGYFLFEIERFLGRISMVHSHLSADHHYFGETVDAVSEV